LAQVPVAAKQPLGGALHVTPAHGSQLGQFGHATSCDE
jgi:hypothetical protein